MNGVLEIMHMYKDERESQDQPLRYTTSYASYGLLVIYFTIYNKALGTVWEAVSYPRT